MTSATHTTDAYDVTDVPSITFNAVKLGLLEAVFVLLFSLAFRVLSGVAETVAGGIILLAGVAAVSLLPGLWTRPRTIEGIAGAAGIGLGATFVFMMVDIVLLQNIGTYTNRWAAVGGSNWWYHPIWWMAGTYLPWMGAWALANNSVRRGNTSPASVIAMAAVFALLLGALAVVVGFPGAQWHVATFGVAFLPGLTLATLVSGRG